MLRGACFLLWVGSSLGAQELAIKGGRILTMAGEPIDGGTVLIRDGKITAVGEKLDIPIDAMVIDATGKTIMPGFVESHSSAAMSQSNETNPNVPYLTVMDSIDPMRAYFHDARSNGVTTVAVVPGNATMIGGQGAVIKTGGTFVEDMVLMRNAGVKISLKPLNEASRMGHLAALRLELDQAKKLLDDEDDGPPDPKKEALVSMVGGKIPAFIYCESAMDVAPALQLAADYDLKSILVLGRKCYLAASEIAESGQPVILDSTLVFWETDPRTGSDKKIVLTKIFQEAGVPFTFQVAASTTSTLGNNFLWYQAACAVKYGMPVQKALEAITLLPARILGVDKFVGSLEPGKDADIVILTGDPLLLDTWVETTIVGGKVVYERGKDRKLKRLLNGVNQ